jgi:acetyl-CoA carboxylase carboxyltransferase component
VNVDPKQIDQLRSARGQRADAARPEVVKRVHAGGKLTARERLAALMDPDSAVLYGTIAAADPSAGPDAPGGPWVSETGGLDAVCTIDGQPAIVSTTDYTDAGGGYGAARLGRLFALARERRWPFVAFVDGGGSRARHPRAGLGHVELSGAIGPYTLFDGMAELSGWVPTISLVSGPSFAGHASVAGFSDIVIATRGSAIGMGGPPMVEAALGKKLTPQELSSAEMQLAIGGIELLCEDEHAAIAAAKRCLGYWRDRPDGEPADDADRVADLVPDSGRYDVRGVIAALADRDSFLELRAPFAPSVVVGFAHMGGRAVGILASNPAFDDGVIDELAAQKIVRHTELCDAWNLPMVVLVDTAGCVTRWVARNGDVTLEPGHSRMHMRCLVAHQTRAVPLLSVQLRAGRGLAPALLTGYTTGTNVPPLMVAWPGVELNRADGFALVRDANAFDDIVDPAETRAMMMRLLRHLPRERCRPSKKRPVDSA